MKQNNQSLDDFLRHKVEEANFSMKEDYWQKMSELLDEEEKKKKRFFFWRGLSVLALLLVAGAGAYLFPKLSHKESAAASQHQTLPQVQQQSVLPSVKQDQPEVKQETQPETNQTTNETTTTSSTSKTNHTSSNNDKTSTTQEKTRALLTDNESNEHTNPSKKEASDETAVTSNTSEPLPNAREARRIERKERKLARREQRKHDESMTNDAVAKEAESEAPSTSTANTSLAVVTPKKTSSKKKVVNESKKAKTDSKPTVAETKTDAVSQSAVTVPVKGKNMKPIDTVQYVKRQPVDQSIYNPRYIGSLANYIPERLDSVTVITYQPVPEVKPAEQKPVETPKDKFKKPPFELMLLAGLNMNKGFKGNVSTPISWGFSPYLGAGIDKQMTPKLTMSTHVGFTYFNGLNSEVKVNSYQYTFGLDSSSLSVAHKKLLQFYLPFSVYYQLFNNHFVMASLGMSYSFDVSSKVSNTSNSSNSGTPAQTPKTVASTKTTTQTGYRTGFNQFDVFAQFGYGYRIANGIMIQASVQQGFFDMTKNSYFSNTVTNTQTRFSLGLKYNFKRN